LRISGKITLCVHVNTLQRCMSEESFKESKGTSSGGIESLKGVGEDSDCGAFREREQRLRPLSFEILPRPEENAQELGRRNIDRRISR
jgi:hypothetical protein